MPNEILRINGNWKIEFISENTSYFGVITFLEGKIFGGDSGYYYFGHFLPLTHKTLGGQISIRRHTDGIKGIFGNQKQIELHLEGKFTDNTFEFMGITIFEPHIDIVIKGVRFYDFAENHRLKEE